MVAKLSSDSDSEDISDINVTPFVDVVLVLLVIFMVTAPMMVKQAISIQLPKATSGDNVTPTQVGISITSNGQVLWNGEIVAIEELGPKTVEALKIDSQVQAVISADAESKHSDLVLVLDTIRNAGLIKFAFEVRRP